MHYLILVVSVLYFLDAKTTNSVRVLLLSWQIMQLCVLVIADRISIVGRLLASKALLAVVFK